jgi:hypothetical protein
MLGTESGLRVSGQKVQKRGSPQVRRANRPDRREIPRRVADAEPAGLFRLFADKLCDGRPQPGAIFAPWHRRRRSRNAVAGLERSQPGRHLRAPTRHPGRRALLGERSVRSRRLSPALSSSPLPTGPRPRRGRVHRIFVMRSQVWMECVRRESRRRGFIASNSSDVHENARCGK